MTLRHNLTWFNFTSCTHIIISLQQVNGVPTALFFEFFIYLISQINLLRFKGKDHSFTGFKDSSRTPSYPTNNNHTLSKNLSLQNKNQCNTASVSVFLKLQNGILVSWIFLSKYQNRLILSHFVATKVHYSVDITNPSNVI